MISSTQRATTILGVTALTISLILYETAISGLPVGFFHFAYFALIMFLAIIYLLSDDRSEVSIAVLLLVLIVIWQLYNLSGGSPLKFSSDESTEWQLVQSIIANGYVPFNSPARKVAVYSAFPGFEIVSASVELVAGIRSDVFMLYAGSIFSSITVLFMFVFFKRLFGQTGFGIKSLIIATFSSSMLTYGALAIHQTLDLLFLWLILFALILPSKLGITRSICFIVGSTALVVTHDLTPFLSLVLGLTYVVLQFLLKNRLTLQRQIIRAKDLLLIASILISWSAFVSVVPSEIAAGAFADLSLLTRLGYAQTALTVTGTKPDWVIYLTILGFITYGLCCVAGIVSALRSGKTEQRDMILLALSGGAVWLLLFTNPFGRPLASTGLQARGLLYLYFFGSPMFVLGVSLITNRKSARLSRSDIRLRLLSVLIVTLSLSPAIYYGFSTYTYDHESPITYNDPRLSQSAMYAANGFAIQFSTTDEIPVVWLSYGMTQGTTNIQLRRMDTLIPYPYHDFGQLIESRCDDSVLLRHSITKIPDPVTEFLFLST